MILTTTDLVEGRETLQVFGLVKGNTIRSRNIGRDIKAVIKNILGGEINDYTKMMAESREQALDRMIEEAEALGANAIVAIRFSTTSMMQGAAELLVTGTAIKIK